MTIFTRRKFLQSSAIAAAGGLLAPYAQIPAFAATGRALDARRLRKFVDELPRPRRLGGSTLDIAVSEFRQKLHADLPPTSLWGYDGSYPGPTIEAERGKPLRVRFRNELQQQTLLAALPMDQTLHWADPLGVKQGAGQQHGHHGGGPRERYAGPVPIITHLHGGEVHAQSDGHPDAWYTPGFERKGAAFAGEWNDYPNAQPAGTLWYHDHVMGVTRITVYAGLAGFYLLRDPELERALNLPSGDYEREILIQDRSFDVNGQLRYPQRGNDPAIHPFWNPESFGDAIVVNGKAWPYMNVEPRKYRLRLLNGANARFFRLRLSDGRPFVQIGSDGGYLAAPVEVKSLMLAPGERADVIIDFSGLAQGKTLVMTNDAATPFPKGDKTDPRSTGLVMQFRGVPLAAADASAIPQKLADAPALGSPVLTRTLTLDEHVGGKGPHRMLLDGRAWSDPVSETPRLGSTELWEIVNLTDDTHPIHLHLVQFQALNRQPIRVKALAKLPRESRQLSRFLSGKPVLPDANERGWKDTLRANPGEVTRFLVRFAPASGGAFAFDATAAPGYVWHCHVLEHEDNEMMRPYAIRP
jgi:FtsP/CotA-like multicopper oxidase with cupredoxin domain